MLLQQTMGFRRYGRVGRRRRFGRRSRYGRRFRRRFARSRASFKRRRGRLLVTKGSRRYNSYPRRKFKYKIGPVVDMPVRTTLFAQQNFTQVASSAAFNYAFIANSVPNPWGLESSANTLQYTKTSTTWDQYVTLASAIKIIVFNNSSAVIEFAVWPSRRGDRGTTVPNKWDELYAQPMCRRGFVGKDVSGKDIKTFKNYVRCNALAEADVSGPSYDQTFQAIGINPTVPVYWNVAYRALDGVTDLANDVQLRVEQLLYVKLKNEDPIGVDME